jgi:hypothetical protein
LGQVLLWSRLWAFLSEGRFVGRWSESWKKTSALVSSGLESIFKGAPLLSTSDAKGHRSGAHESAYPSAYSPVIGPSSAAHAQHSGCDYPPVGAKACGRDRGIMSLGQARNSRRVASLDAMLRPSARECESRPGRTRTRDQGIMSDRGPGNFARKLARFPRGAAHAQQSGFRR